MGADSALHVKDAALDAADTLGTARALAAAIRTLAPFDLVLCGQQGVGGDNSQIPGMLAELLDLPQVTVAVKIEVGDGKATRRARDRRRPRGLGDAAAGRRLGPEGAERAALREPQGDHGREEEADPGARRRGPRPRRGGARAEAERLGASSCRPRARRSG